MMKGKMFFLFLIIVFAGCQNPKKGPDHVEKPIETCYRVLYEQLKKEGSGYYTKYYVESYEKGERNPSLSFDISLERKRKDLAECFMKETTDKIELTTMFAAALKYDYYNGTEYLESKDIDVNAEVLIYGSSWYGVEDWERIQKLAPIFMVTQRMLV